MFSISVILFFLTTTSFNSFSQEVLNHNVGKQCLKVNNLGEEKMTLKEGQVWSYKARENETESRLTIFKIDKENIHHISISGLKIKNTNAPNGYSSEVGHFPMDEDALKASLIALIEECSVYDEDYLEGYESWLDEYTNGDAGYFTIEVIEAVQYIEEALNQ